MRKTGDFKENLIEALKDEEVAKEYLIAAMEHYNSDHNIEIFLTAVKDVAMARGGISSLAEKTHLGRESLYKTLSKKGNPQFETITTILGELGYKLTIERQDANQPSIN